MSKSGKRRDGFEGEKLISLPESVLRRAIRANPVLAHLYVTHIGYFPRASHHHRERRTGCADNILFYCLRGKGWYRIGDRRFEVGVNQFTIIPATDKYLSYGANDADPWTIYWVHFSGNDMAGFNKGFGVGPFDGPHSISLNEKGIDLWHTMYQSLSMGYSTENLTNTNMCLYHFLASFLFPVKPVGRKNVAERDRIHETILFMRNNVGERLQIEDLAGLHQLSVSHFTWLFRKATGMPPLDYFIHLKLQRACLLLHTTRRKIKDIADELGYDDPYYFSRLFKKYMNLSPETYRTNARRDSQDEEDELH